MHWQLDPRNFFPLPINLLTYEVCAATKRWADTGWRFGRLPRRCSQQGTAGLGLIWKGAQPNRCTQQLRRFWQRTPRGTPSWFDRACPRFIASAVPARPRHLALAAMPTDGRFRRSIHSLTFCCKVLSVPASVRMRRHARSIPAREKNLAKSAQSTQLRATLGRSVG